MAQPGTINEAMGTLILEKIEQGQSQTAIAQELGIKQPAVSYFLRKKAMKGNGNVNPVKPQSIGLRSFINKALDTSIDAESWKSVNTDTDMERQLAIDAAERASSAWKSAAVNLSQGRK